MRGLQAGVLSWRALARERPGGCHAAALTPRLPLTSVPRRPRPARRGPRRCGSSPCGPALASAGVSPSARCPACAPRPRPRSFPRNRCCCRRSLSSSPPSWPFRLASAPPAQRARGGGGRDAGAGGGAPPPSASGGVRAPTPRRSAATWGFAGLGSRSLGPARPARRRPLREDWWKLLPRLQRLYKAGLRLLCGPL